MSARRYTAERVAAVQAALVSTCPGDRVSTVVFGSWAREELTAGSDDDWAVMYRQPLTGRSPEVAAAFAAARTELGAGARAPGKQEVFGQPFPVRRLSREIGLEADSNRNFTRRMLVLLECRELAGDALFGDPRADPDSLPQLRRPSTTPAAVPPQRRRALLAHDRRRLRGQAP